MGDCWHCLRVNRTRRCVHARIGAGAPFVSRLRASAALRTESLRCTRRWVKIEPFQGRSRAFEFARNAHRDV